MPGYPAAAAPGAQEAATKYGKRTHLSEEQRLAISRQRNRQHARATRLRKKIFKQVQPSHHFHLAIL